MSKSIKDEWKISIFIFIVFYFIFPFPLLFILLHFFPSSFYAYVNIISLLTHVFEKPLKNKLDIYFTPKNKNTLLHYHNSIMMPRNLTLIQQFYVICSGYCCSPIVKKVCLRDI